MSTRREKFQNLSDEFGVRKMEGVGMVSPRTYNPTEEILFTRLFDPDSDNGVKTALKLIQAQHHLLQNLREEMNYLRQQLEKISMEFYALKEAYFQEEEDDQRE